MVCMNENVSLKLKNICFSGGISGRKCFCMLRLTKQKGCKLCKGFISTSLAAGYFAPSISHSISLSTLSLSLSLA